jgi:hypothetical protein
MQQSSLTPETQRGCASPCETLQPRASRISGRRGIRTPAENHEKNGGLLESGAECGAAGGLTPTPPLDPSDMALLEALLGRWQRLDPTLRDELLARLRADWPI